MANIKNVILKKKIGEVVYDLLVKTSVGQVAYDDSTTLAAKLETMLADISDSKTKLAALLGDDAASSITGQIDAKIKEALDAVKNEEDPTSLAGKIKAVTEAVAAINDPATGAVATAKAYTDEKVGLNGTGYTNVKDYVDAVKTEINSAIAGAFHFKGTVNYVDLLPSSDVANGDVYQVKYAGTSTEAGVVELNAEFAYDGTKFVELGSVVDLSAYSTTAQMTSAIATAKSEAIDAAAADATSKANTAKSEAISEATATAAADATTKADAAKDAAIAVATTKARFLVSDVQPEDLTEADVWAQVIA